MVEFFYSENNPTYYNSRIGYGGHINKPSKSLKRIQLLLNIITICEKLPTKIGCTNSIAIAIIWTRITLLICRNIFDLSYGNVVPFSIILL
jgi:hypothetical protein